MMKYSICVVATVCILILMVRAMAYDPHNYCVAHLVTAFIAITALWVVAT